MCFLFWTDLNDFFFFNYWAKDLGGLQFSCNFSKWNRVVIVIGTKKEEEEGEERTETEIDTSIV